MNALPTSNDIYVICHGRADPDGGGDRVSRPPLKNHKNIGFLCNTGPDPLKITKLLSQHSMLGLYPPPPPSTKKKNVIKFGPPLTKLSGSAQPLLSSLLTIWTQTRPSQMFGSIWIQTDIRSDGFPETTF